MKTLKTIIITALVTAIIIGGLAFGFLFNGNNVRIEERTKDHNKTVVYDGVVVENKNWTETLGYEVKIDIFDGVYVGK